MTEPFTTTWRLALLASAGSLICMTGTPAAAQSSDASGPATTRLEQGAFQDIIVTARRREEQSQQVPVAVTAIAGKDLARQSIVTLSDITTKVPSVQILASAFGANVPRFVIRGQSQFEPLFSQDPSAAIYFADVVQARAQGVNGAMYDLASVQVLKGPQGTLFGRNSTGGAILISPQEPTDRFEGYGTAGVGNYGLRSLEGAVNVPVSENLQVRLSGRSFTHDGYTKALNSGIRFDDADSWSLRLGIKAKLGDRLTNTLFVNNFKATENGTAFKLYNARPTLAAFTLGQVALDEFAASAHDGFHTIRSDLPANSSRIETWGVENTTVFEADRHISFKNIFGYRHVKSDIPFDFDGSTVDMYEGTVTMNANQFSDELQIIGDWNIFDFIGGAYVFKESGRELQDTLLDFRPVFMQAASGQADVTNKSQSVFAQGNFHVPGVEGLTVTAGLRYTWDQRDLTRVAFNGTTCSLTDADIGGQPLDPCTRSGHYKHSELTYTAGIDWQVTPDKLLYFVTRKGYRSGGINQRSNIPSQFIPYQPETVTDYEIGLKADWDLGPAGRLRTNIDAYYQNYNDIQRTQTQTVGTPPNTILITNVVNAAKARVKGLEIDATWTPIPALTLRGYYSLTDARYKQWLVPIVGGAVQDRSDYPFASVPKHSGGGSVTLRHDFGDDIGELSLSGDLYAQSQFQMIDDNVLPEGLIAGYTVINSRLEWDRVMGKPVNLSFWVRNLAGNDYWTSGVTVAGAGLGYTVRMPGAPRTFGFSARFDF